MPTVRLTLSSLRQELRDWEAQCASGMDLEEAPTGAILEFFYSENSDGNERLKLTNAQFWGEEGSDGEGAEAGWPKPGFYFAQAKAGPGKKAPVLFEWSGAHLSEDFHPQEMERADSGNGHIERWQKAHESTYDRLQNELNRVDRRARQAEERENSARREKQSAVDALSVIKKENLELQIALGQMLHERDSAFAERDVAIHNLEIMEEEGGEMAPVAGVAVQSAVDRVVDWMGVNSDQMPPPIRDRYEAICVWLISRNDIWPMLVPAGLPYEAMRYLLVTIHGVDPGPEPPPPGQPWIPNEERRNAAEEGVS